VFLDESTSALEEGHGFTALPDCIVVSVSHRQTVEQQHDHCWNCSVAAQWWLSALGEALA
jgi:putative ATP-binding cassette transporter